MTHDLDFDMIAAGNLLHACRLLCRVADRVRAEHDLEVRMNANTRLLEVKAHGRTIVVIGEDWTARIPEAMARKIAHLRTGAQFP